MEPISTLGTIAANAPQGKVSVNGNNVLLDGKLWIKCCGHQTALLLGALTKRDVTVVGGSDCSVLLRAVDLNNYFFGK